MTASFVILGLLLAATAFGIGSAAGSAIAWGLFSAVGGRGDAASRARATFVLRMLPTAAGATLALFAFSPAWLSFEPRGTHAVVGWPLGLAAALVGGLATVGLARASHALWQSRRLAADWLRSARPIALPGASMPAFRIEHPFPVVAIAGLTSPRLFVASQVIDGCTAEELGAVVAHEEAHRFAGDNLKILAMRGCGDVLALLPVGRAMQRAWSEAAEQAADDAAARSAADALHLASALVKVARMAGPGTLAAPLAAFYETGTIAARVARLVDARAASAAAGATLWPALAIVAAAVAAAAAALRATDALAHVHAVAEALVHL